MFKSFEAGRNGLPMPSANKRGTGTMAAIIGGACGATAIVAFSVGRWMFPKQEHSSKKGG